LLEEVFENGEKMLKCKICKKVTKNNVPTGKYKLWGWITDSMGKKIGKKTLSEKSVCMNCNREVLLK